jgi:ubiquinone/menaquinone biosynthesis C-methylase UbiE
MADPRVNYDQVAPTYHQRYAVNRLEGVAAALRALAQDRLAGRVLEVGCGTGRWLDELRPFARWVVGLDLSPGMLRQARASNPQAGLACGQAHRLPFPDAAFDLVFCINALHHFDQPEVFIAEARRLLRPGGALASIGLNPHSRRDRWYVYECFEGTLETDLRRFPSPGRVVDWMIAAGFEQVEWRVVERIVHRLVGREVFGDPFLGKETQSQLILLSDDAYAAGLRRIEVAIAEAEATGEERVFPVDLSLMMVTGWIETVP